jgi:hypothetical protein
MEAPMAKLKDELAEEYEDVRAAAVLELVQHRMALRGLLDAVETAKESLPPAARTVLRGALAGREDAARVVLGE